MKRSNKGEVTISFAIIALSLLLFGRYLIAFSTTSLWTDELYSIMNFSSKGILTVITDYKVPNNHIFFNFLNALLPQIDSYNPLRARVISLISVSLSIFLVLNFFFRGKKYFEGALFLAFVAANFQLLDLVLQARGYGLLMLISILIYGNAMKFLRKEISSFQVISLAILCCLGTWTIPSYAIFVGSLALTLLVLAANRRAVVIFGVIYFFITLIIYLPVLDQVISNMRTYSGQWGKEFEFGQAVFDFFREYLFFGSDWQILLFWVAVFLLFQSLLKKLPEDMNKILTMLFYSTALTLVGYLFIETATVRTSFFLILPIIVGVLLLLHYLRCQFSKFGMSYMITISLFCSFFLVIEFYEFQFIPKENWKRTAEFIEKNCDPSSVIYCPFRPQFLQAYLDPTYKVTSNFDQELFDKGKLIYVDADFFSKDRSIDFVNNMKIWDELIPQRRGSYQILMGTSEMKSNVAFVKVADSLTLEANCCSWASREFEIFNLLNSSVLSFDLQAQNLDSSLTFQMLLLNGTDCTPFKTLEIEPSESKASRHIIGISSFRNKGNCELQTVTKIVFRIKTRKPLASLTIRNVSLRQKF